ncbi:MAG TPA: iron chelate uptake ABC transporter family permease subunit, partial [Actinomycetota bacterium]|nr:iron chelate uptake ABC transporter family permease subunit [Actinomycetota bacterium]
MSHALAVEATALRRRRLSPFVIAGSVLVLGLIGLAAILVGPVDLGAGAVVKALVDRLPFVNAHSGLSSPRLAILWQLRVPRVVLGGLVGATLALCGAAYQGVFRNPLADPYLLGVA